MSVVDAVTGSTASLSYSKIIADNKKKQDKSDKTQPKESQQKGTQTSSSMPMYSAVGVPIIQVAAQKAEAPKTQPKDREQKHDQRDGKQTLSSSPNSGNQQKGTQAFSSGSNSSKRYAPMYSSVNPFVGPAPKVSLWGKVGSFLGDLNREIGLPFIPSVTEAATLYNPPAYVKGVTASAPAGSYNQVVVTFNASTDPDPGVNITQYQIIGVPKSLIGTAAYPTIDDLITAINNWNMPSQAWTKYETDVSKTKYIEKYTDIPSGDYIVMVRAENSVQLWSAINYVPGSNSGSDSIYGVDAAEPVVSVAAAPAIQPPTPATVNSAVFTSANNGTGTVAVTHTLSADPQGEAVTYEAVMINKDAANKTYGSLQGLIDAQNGGKAISWNTASPDFAASTGTLSIGPFDPSHVPTGQYYVLVLAKNADGMFAQVSANQVYQNLSITWLPNPVTVTSAAEKQVTGGFTVTDTFNQATDPAGTITSYQMGVVDANLVGAGKTYATLQDLLNAMNNGATVPWVASSGWVNGYNNGSISATQNLAQGTYYTFVMAKDDKGNTSQLTANSVQSVAIPAPVPQIPDPVVVTAASETQVAGGFKVTDTFNQGTDSYGTVTAYQMGVIDASIVGTGKTYATLQDLLNAINSGASITWAASSGWVNGYNGGSISATQNLAKGTYYTFVMAKDDQNKTSQLTTNSVQTVNIPDYVPQIPDPVTVTAASETQVAGGFQVTDTFTQGTDKYGNITAYQMGVIDASIVGAGKTYATLQDLLNAINSGANIAWAASSGWVNGYNGGSISATQNLAKGTYYTFVMSKDDQNKTSQLTTNSVQTVNIPDYVPQIPDPVTVTGASVAQVTGGFQVTDTFAQGTDKYGTVTAYQMGVIDASIVGAGKTYATLQDLLNAMNSGASITWAASSGWVTGYNGGTITSATQNLAKGTYYTFVMSKDDQNKTSQLTTNSVQTVNVPAYVSQIPDPVTVTAASELQVTGGFKVTDTFNQGTDKYGTITSYQMGVIDASIVGAGKAYATLQDLLNAINSGASITWAASSGWVAGYNGTISATQNLAKGTYYTFVMSKDDQNKTSQLTTDSVKSVDIPDYVSQIPDPVTVTAASELQVTGGFKVTDTFNQGTDKYGTITSYQMGVIDASIVGTGKTYATLQDLLNAINSGASITWAASSGWVAGYNGTISATQNLAKGTYYTFVMSKDDQNKTSQLTTDSVKSVDIPDYVPQIPDPVTVTGATATQVMGGFQVTDTFTQGTDKYGTITGYQMGVIDASIVGTGKTYATLQDLLNAINSGASIPWAASSGWVAGYNGTISATQNLAKGTYYTFVMSKDDQNRVSQLTTNSVQSVIIPAYVSQIPDPVTVTSAAWSQVVGGSKIIANYNQGTDKYGTVIGYQMGVIDASIVGAGKTYATLQDLLNAMNNGASIPWAASSGWVTGYNNGVLTATQNLPQGTYYVFVMDKDDQGKTSQLTTDSVKSVDVPVTQPILPLAVKVRSASYVKTTVGYNVTVIHDLTTVAVGKITGYKAVVLKPGVLGSTTYPTLKDLENAINGTRDASGNLLKPKLPDDAYVGGNATYIASTGSIAVPTIATMPDGPYTIYVVAQDDEGDVSPVDDGSFTTLQIGNPPAPASAYRIYSHLPNAVTGQEKETTWFIGENNIFLVLPNASVDAKNKIKIRISTVTSQLLKEFNIDLSNPSVSATKVDDATKSIKIPWDHSALAYQPCIVQVYEENQLKTHNKYERIFIVKASRPGGVAQ